MADLFFGPSMPRRSDMGTEAVESRIRDVRVDDAMVRIVYSYHGARNIKEEIADGTNALVIESGAGALTRIIHERISASTDPID